MKYIFEYGLWENDFLLNEILPEGNVEYVKPIDLEHYQSRCDVFAFSCRTHDFWNIRNTVKRIKPKVIIMLSDEFYQENKWNYNMLGNYCDLFLRQYHHSFYNYTSNTLHFPLGYTNGCKTFSYEKKYDWSFIGNLKSDRKEMIDAFSQMSNHFMGNNISKEKMCEIYSQSTFVPCGRGNSSLDCFRLYEASMNGAIPVVVGFKEEIENTFKYEENPPWIFAESWNDAFNKCMSTIIQSKDVICWWENRIQKVRSKILEVL